MLASARAMVVIVPLMQLWVLVPRYILPLKTATQRTIKLRYRDSPVLLPLASIAPLHIDRPSDFLSAWPQGLFPNTTTTTTATTIKITRVQLGGKWRLENASQCCRTVSLLGLAQQAFKTSTPFYD